MLPALSNMYYSLQNDVRPPMAGRLTGTVGCAASHPGSAAQYTYPSALTFAADQTRWAGSGTRRAGRPASQMSAAKVPVANRCWSVCGLEHGAVHGNSALILSIVIYKINTATLRWLDGNLFRWITLNFATIKKVAISFANLDCLTAYSSITWTKIIKFIRLRNSSDEYHLKVRSNSGQIRLNYNSFFI